ncbi:MAG: YlbF family regulator [Alicyclobacillaceae bacterium]|nr:YlbF family regulator [Alicyclobacillaceae bacterium]
MNNPYDHAHALARAIQQSEWYLRLKEARAKLEQNPDAKRMADDLRKRSFSLQAKRLAGQTVTPEEEEQLKKLQEVAFLHPAVREYVEAETRFGVFMADIQRILAEAVEPVVDWPKPDSPPSS